MVYTDSLHQVTLIFHSGDSLSNIHYLKKSKLSVLVVQKKFDSQIHRHSTTTDYIWSISPFYLSSI